MQSRMFFKGKEDERFFRVLYHRHKITECLEFTNSVFPTISLQMLNKNV